jgi:hypothetical protein
MRTEQGGRRFEFCLPAARDVNARAFFHENLSRRQADPRVSTSDDSDLSIEFRHFFLPQACRLNHAVFQDAARSALPLAAYLHMLAFPPEHLHMLATAVKDRTRKGE